MLTTSVYNCSVLIPKAVILKSSICIVYISMYGKYTGTIGDIII